MHTVYPSTIYLRAADDPVAAVRDVHAATADPAAPYDVVRQERGIGLIADCRSFSMTDKQSTDQIHGEPFVDLFRIDRPHVEKELPGSPTNVSRRRADSTRSSASPPWEMSTRDPTILNRAPSPRNPM